MCISNECEKKDYQNDNLIIVDDYQDLLKDIDAVFIVSHPSNHYSHVKMALQNNIHVLCESPIALKEKEYLELLNLSKKNNLILMDSIKTAYSTAFDRLLLLIKGGMIGDVISVEATCTSLREFDVVSWSSITSWGPTALLPIFKLLGTDYLSKEIFSLCATEDSNFDLFSKINFHYRNAVASIIVGKGVKSEGDLIISGTKGYAYVPAPWWKTDYFELRFENPNDNKKYFYQLEGEGIRYELVAFAKSINLNKNYEYIEQDISSAICRIIEEFERKNFKNIEKY